MTCIKPSLCLKGLEKTVKIDKTECLDNSAEEQIRMVFDDNIGIIFVISPQKHAEAILMSTHNLCFYGELLKITL